MPSLFFYILCRVGAFVPFGRLQQWGRPPLFLPFYHLVSDENPSHVRYLYPVRTVRQFRDDLDFFLQHYCPVSLEAALKVSENCSQPVSGVRRGRPAMHLSFDDGLRECFEVVMPILLEKGVPATFFLNPDFVDNRDLMFRYKASLLCEAGVNRPIGPLSVPYAQRYLLDEQAAASGVDFTAFLEKQRPYLSTEQIHTMQDKGFTFGAHSMDHPMYRQISPEEQLSQTLESILMLRKRFGLRHDVFAFPFTDDGVGRAFFQKMQAALGAPLYTFGSAGLKFDAVPTNLQRFPMEKTNLPASRLVPAEYAAFLMKKMLGRHRVER